MGNDVAGCMVLRACKEANSASHSTDVYWFTQWHKILQLYNFAMTNIRTLYFITTFYQFAI